MLVNLPPRLDHGDLVCDKENLNYLEENIRSYTFG